MDITIPNEVTVGVAYVIMPICFVLFLCGGFVAAKAAHMAHDRQLDTKALPMAGWIVAAIISGISALVMLVGFLFLFVPLMEKLAKLI